MRETESIYKLHSMVNKKYLQQVGLKFIESTTADEKAISDFLEPTAHRNSSTKNQRTRLQSYRSNLRMSRHCCKSILQKEKTTDAICRKYRSEKSQLKTKVLVRNIPVS